MAIRDFWYNVRAAAGLLTHVPVADVPKLDANRIEEKLQDADVWLNSQSVGGFDERDFDFLNAEERKRLVECVRQFRSIASSVPKNTSPTPEQIAEAKPAFVEILKILRPDKYSDPDTMRIGKRIEEQVRGQLPDWVHDLRFETGNDHIGDPAVFIWAEIDDSIPQRETYSRSVSPVRDLLEQTVRTSFEDLWPYIRFRSVSEIAAFQE